MHLDPASFQPINIMTSTHSLDTLLSEDNMTVTNMNINIDLNNNGGDDVSLFYEDEYEESIRDSHHITITTATATATATTATTINGGGGGGGGGSNTINAAGIPLGIVPKNYDDWTSGDDDTLDGIDDDDKSVVSELSMSRHFNAPPVRRARSYQNTPPQQQQQQQPQHYQSATHKYQYEDFLDDDESDVASEFTEDYSRHKNMTMAGDDDSSSSSSSSEEDSFADWDSDTSASDEASLTASQLGENRRTNILTFGNAAASHNADDSSMEEDPLLNASKTLLLFPSMTPLRNSRKRISTESKIEMKSPISSPISLPPPPPPPPREDDDIISGDGDEEVWSRDDDNNNATILSPFKHVGARKRHSTTSTRRLSLTNFSVGTQSQTPSKKSQERQNFQKRGRLASEWSSGSSSLSDDLRDLDDSYNGNSHFHHHHHHQQQQQQTQKSAGSSSAYNSTLSPASASHPPPVVVAPPLAIDIDIDIDSDVGFDGDNDTQSNNASKSNHRNHVAQHNHSIEIQTQRREQKHQHELTQQKEERQKDLGDAFLDAEDAEEDMKEMQKALQATLMGDTTLSTSFSSSSAIDDEVGVEGRRRGVPAAVTTAPAVFDGDIDANVVADALASPTFSPESQSVQNFQPMSFELSRIPPPLSSGPPDWEKRNSFDYNNDDDADDDDETDLESDEIKEVASAPVPAPVSALFPVRDARSTISAIERTLPLIDTPNRAKKNKTGKERKNRKPKKEKKRKRKGDDSDDVSMSSTLSETSRSEDDDDDIDGRAGDENNESSMTDDEDSLASEYSADSIQSLNIKKSRKKDKKKDKKKKKKKKKDRPRKRGRRADFEGKDPPPEQEPIKVSERIDAIFNNKELIFAAPPPKPGIDEDDEVSKSSKRSTKSKSKSKHKEQKDKDSSSKKKDASKHKSSHSKASEKSSAKSVDKSSSKNNNKSDNKKRKDENKKSSKHDKADLSERTEDSDGTMEGSLDLADLMNDTDVKEAGKKKDSKSSKKKSPKNQEKIPSQESKSDSKSSQEKEKDKNRDKSKRKNKESKEEAGSSKVSMDLSGALNDASDNAEVGNTILEPLKDAPSTPLKKRRGREMKEDANSSKMSMDLTDLMDECEPLKDGPPSDSVTRADQSTTRFEGSTRDMPLRAVARAKSMDINEPIMLSPGPHEDENDNEDDIDDEPIRLTTSKKALDPLDGTSRDVPIRAVTRCKSIDVSKVPVRSLIHMKSLDVTQKTILKLDAEAASTSESGLEVDDMSDSISLDLNDVHQEKLAVTVKSASDPDSLQGSKEGNSGQSSLTMDKDQASNRSLPSIQSAPAATGSPSNSWKKLVSDDLEKEFMTPRPRQTKKVPDNSPQTTSALQEAVGRHSLSASVAQLILGSPLLATPRKKAESEPEPVDEDDEEDENGDGEFDDSDAYSEDEIWESDMDDEEDEVQSLVQGLNDVDPDQKPDAEKRGSLVHTKSLQTIDSMPSLRTIESPSSHKSNVSEFRRSLTRSSHSMDSMPSLRSMDSQSFRSYSGHRPSFALSSIHSTESMPSIRSLDSMPSLKTIETGDMSMVSGAEFGRSSSMSEHSSPMRMELALRFLDKKSREESERNLMMYESFSSFAHSDYLANSERSAYGAGLSTTSTSTVTAPPLPTVPSMPTTPTTSNHRKNNAKKSQGSRGTLFSGDSSDAVIELEKEDTLLTNMLKIPNIYKTSTKGHAPSKPLNGGLDNTRRIMSTKNPVLKQDEYIAMDNGSYVRTRIQRIRRKIVELELRTQEELCYLELDFNKRKDFLLEQVESFRDPYNAIAFLHKMTVKELHEEQTELRKQIKGYESDLSLEIAKSVKLTNESFEMQRKTRKVMESIQTLEKENAKQIMALEHLNYVQGLVGNLLQRRSPFDPH